MVYIALNHIKNHKHYPRDFKALIQQNDTNKGKQNRLIHVCMRECSKSLCKDRFQVLLGEVAYTSDFY